MAGTLYYMLDDAHRVMKAPNPNVWSDWYRRKGTADDPTRVGRWEHESGAWVSTVFLGLDHAFGRQGPPILFETMVFGIDDPLSMAEDWMDRCSTWDEALAMHERGIQWLKEHVKAPRKRSDRAIELLEDE